MGWQFLLLHHPLKCPTLPFGRSCNLRDGRSILLYSYAATIHKAVAQSHSAIHIYETVQNPQQCNVNSYTVSRRRTSTWYKKFDVEYYAVHSTWLSFILYDFTWVQPVTSWPSEMLLASCHWMAIADVSKQCITVILTSQVDGVEFFTPSFPILFETSLSIPATTQQNPRE